MAQRAILLLVIILSDYRIRWNELVLIGELIELGSDVSCRITLNLSLTYNSCF